MTNQLNFGDHLIVGLSGGVKLSSIDREILVKYKPAGVLLLARNFHHGASYQDWLKDLNNLLEEIYSLTNRDKMLITLDHEGGRVVRTPPPITAFPPAILYKKNCGKVAKSTALELQSLGVNVSWAPVADIHSNESNPIIGARAFGLTSKEAAQYAVNYHKGLLQNGIISCAKHFPGHGDTTQDSHTDLPVLNLNLNELKRRELIPFQKLIKAGVPMIMTAHILFPKIDPDNTATTSKKILHDLLREKLKFEGVIVSDDLDMKAVSESFNSYETFKRSLIAGCDMYIIARHLEKDGRRVDLTAQFYEKIVSEGNSEILKNLIISKNRIDKLLKKAGKYSPKILTVKELVKNNKLSLKITGLT